LRINSKFIDKVAQIMHDGQGFYALQGNTIFWKEDIFTEQLARENNNLEKWDQARPFTNMQYNYFLWTFISGIWIHNIISLKWINLQSLNSKIHSCTRKNQHYKLRRYHLSTLYNLKANFNFSSPQWFKTNCSKFHSPKWSHSCRWYK